MAKARNRKDPFPDRVSPMLATLLKEPFDDPEFVHEVKWDGYRIIAFVEKGKVRLDSRSGLDYTNKYSTVVSALKKLKRNAVIDGEIVVLNDKGLPDFDALQKNLSPENLVYYVFDLLWLDGVNLMSLTLEERKQQLEELTAGTEVIRYSNHFENGTELFAQMEKIGMEGIVSKRRSSQYVAGQRGNNWYKIPTVKRQEFVIGGWVESDAREFRTLLFGAYEGKKLKWIGHSGGGFKTKEMPAILKKLKSLEIKESPFVNKVEYSQGKPRWVKPELVGNFKFATWTTSGKIRKPAIFLGFRDDKKATQVVREVPKEVLPTISEKSHLSKAKPKSERKRPASPDSNWIDVEKIPVSSHDSLKLQNCTIELTNVERQVWQGVTKADLIQYYHSVSEYILPHIKSRPQSLHLKLVNAGAPGLYIKDMEGREPDCAEIFSDKRKHKKAGKRDVIDYLVCNNEATLLYMINLGCIDVNPWTSRVTNPIQPDYIVIDLDPSDEDFKKAIETARAAKQFFDSWKLKVFPKTSGKSGIHLYIPCKEFDFTQARAIAETICNEVHQLVPGITTTAVSISQRGTKLYLDSNQNDYADTVAAPYSVRPWHAPTVSTPLDWKEINPRIDPASFTIHNTLKRLEKKGDIFLGVMEEATAIKNSKILAALLP